MRLGTTPTHEFTLSIPIDQLKEVEISYQQNGEILLIRHLKDCEVDGNVLRTTLTQEETLEFKKGALVEIQIRALDVRGKVAASDVMTITVERTLSREVLT